MVDEVKGSKKEDVSILTHPLSYWVKRSKQSFKT